MIHTENDGGADPQVLRASDISGHPKDWRGEEKNRTINSKREKEKEKGKKKEEKKRKKEDKMSCLSSYLLPFSFVVHLSFCTQRRQFFLSKALVYHCLLVFRRIGEYVSLDLFHYSKQKTKQKTTTNKQNSQAVTAGHPFV